MKDIDITACDFYPFTDLPGRTVASEHELIRTNHSRYDNHRLFIYELPKVDDSGLKFDGRYTTETGWDDADKPVMQRHIDLMRYAGIGCAVFTTYGGLEIHPGKRKFVTYLEEPLKQFSTLVRDDSTMTFAPLICLSTPRFSLPVDVTESDIDTQSRIRFANPESLKILVDYLLSTYGKHDRYLSINGKKVLFFFDAVKTAVNNKGGMTIHGLTHTLDKIKSQHDVYLVSCISRPRYASPAQTVGFDAMTTYVDLPHYDDKDIFPIQDYREVTQRRVDGWKKVKDESKIPFNPSPASGWDATSRVKHGIMVEDANRYPLVPVIPVTDDQLTIFSWYTRQLLEICRANPAGERIFKIAGWTEMSEGASVIPRYQHGSTERDSSLIKVVRNVVCDES